MNRSRLAQNKGVGIVAVILIMLIIGVMGSSMASLISNNTMTSVNYLQSQQALFLAESGIQRAMYEISKGAGTWSGWSGTDPKTIQLTLNGYGDYNISVASPEGTAPTISSTGYVPNRMAAIPTIRVINAVARNSNLFAQYAAFAGSSSGIGVSMGSQSLTDSYNSDRGLYNFLGNKTSNGNVGTNADIDANGNASILGDASTGPSGVFNDTNVVSGSITHENEITVPEVVVPAVLTGLASEGDITNTSIILPGNHKYTQISPNSNQIVTIIGPANIYITGSPSIQTNGGNSQILISPLSTGPVVIYADGDILMSAVGIVNASLIPANFQLYGSSSSMQNINLASKTDFYGIIYAPKGSMNIASQFECYGSLIADTINIGAHGKIHLDLALKNLNLPSFMSRDWKISKWKEIY